MLLARSVVGWTLVAASLCVGTVVRAADPPAPDRDRLMTIVEALASPEMAGRGTPDAREKAAGYLADAMAKTGAKPPPGRSSFTVALPSVAGTGIPKGTNVLGWIPGA